MLRAIWFVPPALATAADALNDVPASAQVQSRLTQSSDEQFEALMADASDFAVTAIDNVFAWNTRAPRGTFKVIAQIERTTPLSVIARPQHDTFADLRGGELLVDAPDNGFVIALRALLDDHGVPPGSYSLVPAGGVKQRLDALIEGRGDATLLGPPFDLMALSKGYPSLGTVNAAYPDFPGQGVVARDDGIARAFSALVDWTAALDAARRWIDGNRDTASKLLAERGVPAAIADMIPKANPATLAPDRRGIDLLIDQRRRYGAHPRPVTYDDIVDPAVLQAAGAWTPSEELRS